MCLTPKDAKDVGHALVTRERLLCRRFLRQRFWNNGFDER